MYVNFQPSKATFPLQKLSDCFQNQTDVSNDDYKKPALFHKKLDTKASGIALTFSIYLFFLLLSPKGGFKDQ